MSNIINWFEIPVTDFERAVKFYEQVFQATFRREDMDNMQMAIFPYQEPQPGGALVKFEHYRPSADGTIVYLQTQARAVAATGQGRRRGSALSSRGTAGRHRHHRADH